MKKITLLFLLFSSSIQAADEVVASPVNYGANFVQMLLGLFFIIAMILGLVWLLKKIGYKGYAGTEMMKVKSCLPLSTKEKLMLVEVGQEQFVIGVAPGFIGHIKTLNASATEESTTEKSTADENKESEPSLFSDKLKAMLNNNEKMK